MSEAGRNRAEYERRVNRVIDHIQAHRAESLPLERLAAVAAFSPFHFHRVFKAMTGETVSEFVQRVRLESAASALLLRPQTDVLTIALDCGFNSAGAFARAFKERFGMSATQWRAGGFARWRAEGRDFASKIGTRERKMREAVGKPCEAPAGGDLHDDVRSRDVAATEKETTMTPTVTIQTLPSYRLAYLRNIGAYGAGGTIPATWQRLWQWAAARDLWTPDWICIGISYDDPHVTEPSKCRYDAGIVIPERLSVEDGINVASFAGGKVAAARFVGTARDIAQAWHDLFSWLPQSGFQPDERPCAELYRGESMDGQTGVVTCDLCLPVRPL